MLPQAHRRLLSAVAALWALPQESLDQYLTLRKPSLTQTATDVHVGRASLPRAAQPPNPESAMPGKALLKQVCRLGANCAPAPPLAHMQKPLNILTLHSHPVRPAAEGLRLWKFLSARTLQWSALRTGGQHRHDCPCPKTALSREWCVQGKAFAATGHVMRSMEAVAVAASQQEPVLLVGETGTGKTTLVQHLAEQASLPEFLISLRQTSSSSAQPQHGVDQM